ncbi:hypothetical protein V5R04_01525 [Jonesiaceae bacterium BS-20]|uniref:ABC transporter permease subunit n=1 Tax=Jonesiaceae bacterium BS-20 TaxID=3120821 RepID=A0AAU7DVA8_9MICO
MLSTTGSSVKDRFSKTATAIRAEWYWLLKRRAFKIGSLLSVLIGLAVPLARWASTSSNVGLAIEQAEKDAVKAAESGLEIPLEALYQEPRYPLAVQLPIDVGAVTLAIGVVFLITAALSVGAEWRVGTNRLAFASPKHRGSAMGTRVLTWWLGTTAVGLASIALTIIGLVLVGFNRGLAEGLTSTMIVGLLIRGTLVIGGLVTLGAGLATVFRSDVVVVSLALVYVITAEIILVGLLAVSGYRSPGNHALLFVGANDPLVTIDHSCGPAPRCDPAYLPVWGSPIIYLVTVFSMIALVVVAVWATRRPIWK